MKTTPDRLHELLHYDPLTGHLTWRIQRSNLMPGSRAGTVHHSGYVHLCVDGGHVAAHRAAWAMVHGAWPTMQIDHINGDKADNRIANLRLATPSANSGNQHRAKSQSTTGLLGVMVRRNSPTSPFQARITVKGVRRNLGSFMTAAAAHAAYMAARYDSEAEALDKQDRQRFPEEA